MQSPPDPLPDPLGLRFDSVNTLVDLLRHRGTAQATTRGYTFLEDGETDARHVDYGELDRRARAIAAQLQQAGVRPGERALLLYPPGLDYVAGFLGCLAAGVVAVPVYPPDMSRLGRTLPRIRTIVADAEATAALTTSPILAIAEAMLLAEAPDLARLRWLATDAAPDGAERAWREVPLSRDSLALLQYTSGSTGTPKGVMLSHANLLHNSALIGYGFGLGPSPVGVIWLPPYHDMGLIGGILQPLYAGLPVVLMSPIAFLQRPLRWLEAISRFRGTASGGPNFAYDLCVRKSTPEERARLDLSSWELAFSGAEPVRPETLDRFAKAFGPAGFRREAFYPCYGLAEGTLIVSGGTRGAPLAIRAFTREGLERGEAVAVDAAGAHAAADSDHQRVLVGCGRALPDEEIRVVDPETLLECAEGLVGEIWVRGPSVAQGYWRRAALSAETFGAFTRLGEGPFLRTGDLGFASDGQLFVAGRLKDLVIIRGRNHHPQDIELTVEQCHPAMRPGCGAAFSVDVGGEERLVIVQEYERRYRPDRRAAPRPGEDRHERREGDPEIDARVAPIASAEEARRLRELHEPPPALDPADAAEVVREAVASHHQIQAYAVVLIKAGTIPKTSSGKIQRFACRQAFVQGSLEVLAESRTRAARGSSSMPASTAPSKKTTAPPPPAALVELQQRAAGLAAHAEPDDELPGWIAGYVARLARVDRSSVELEQPLARYGLDSLAAIELQNALERHLGVSVPMATVLAGPSARELAASVRELLAAARAASAPAESTTSPDLAAVSPVGEHPVSHGQRALWFLSQLAPESTAYHISAAARIRAGLDVRALERALCALAARHPALRTTFEAREDEPVQRVHAALAPGFETRDARGWSAAALDAALADAARRPFDLSAGPLVRAHVFARGEGEGHVVLLTLHHIIADFWSLAVFARELGTVYAAECRGAPAALDPLHVQYADYARWQAERLAGPAGEALRGYWRGALRGAPPRLIGLPADRPRPATQTFHGATVSRALPRELLARLSALGREHGATLFVTLLAGFQALLYRLSGQRDLVVGAPTAGRTRSEVAGVVGYFVNPVPLRARVEGATSFVELLAQARATTLGALAHQEYPFDLLVEQLRAEREPDASPVFQTVFVLQKSQRVEDDGLAMFALGEAGGVVDLGGLRVESMRLENTTAQFDLTMSAAVCGDELIASLEFNTDLFDRATAVRMLEQYRALLEGAAADPLRAVDALPLGRTIATPGGALAPGLTPAGPISRIPRERVAISPARAAEAPPPPPPPTPPPTPTSTPTPVVRTTSAPPRGDHEP